MRRMNSKWGWGMEGRKVAREKEKIQQGKRIGRSHRGQAYRNAWIMGWGVSPQITLWLLQQGGNK